MQALLPLHAALLHSALLAHGMLVLSFHVAIAGHPFCTRGANWSYTRVLFNTLVGLHTFNLQFIVDQCCFQVENVRTRQLNARRSFLLKLSEERHRSFQGLLCYFLSAKPPYAARIEMIRNAELKKSTDVIRDSVWPSAVPLRAFCFGNVELGHRYTDTQVTFGGGL